MRAIIWAAVSTKSQVAEGRESLQSQVKLAQEVCVKNGWEITDILEVPGHSRRYIDIYQLAESASLEGIHAFRKLLNHFNDADFDILVVRDADRFARTQTLHAMIVESTINIGAKIYSLADGIIDEHNFRMWIALGGYRAAGEVDGLLKKMRIGYDARFKRGLPVNANVVSSHKLARDPLTGAITHIEVDEDKRQEYRDLATLILEGVAWSKIESEMYNRFGYANEKGEPYKPQRYYRIVSTPSFWGHISRGHKMSKKGRWVYEEGHAIPDGVEISYNEHEPMYTGDLAEQIKSELDRRSKINGRRSPQRSYIFSGLLICAVCMNGMSYNIKGNYKGIRCNASIKRNCDHSTMVNEKRGIKTVALLLEEIFNANTIHALTGDRSSVDLSETLEEVEKQINQLNSEIMVMINRQAQSPESVQEVYHTSIRTAGERLDLLKKRREDIRQQIAITFSSSRRERNAILDISRLGDSFWSLPPNKINQLLGQLLGAYRFVALNGDIIGIALPPS